MAKNFDNFTNIPFIKDNLDLFYIRTSIFNSIKNQHNILREIFSISAVVKCLTEVIFLKILQLPNIPDLILKMHLQYDAGIKPDYTWDGITMPFESEQFETAFGTEVLEHCPNPKVILSEVYRVLKPGGVFFFTVPFLWPLHEVPHDEFRYTPFSMKRLLGEAGFLNIEIKATGGWHSSLAQMLGLWVRRAPISPGKRKYLSHVIKARY